MAVSQETICKCGKKKYWLIEDEVTKTACPECGRKYLGRYNSKTLHLEAIEQG